MDKIDTTQCSWQLRPHKIKFDNYEIELRHSMKGSLIQLNALLTRQN